jgi:hypothetical protein
MNDRAKKPKNTGAAATEKAKTAEKPKSRLAVAGDASLRLLPVVVTPALQYWLKALHLKPLSVWGQDAVDTLPIVTYIITTASAAAASFFGAPTNRVKGWIVIIAGLVLIASYSTYTFWILAHTATRYNILLYYSVAFLSFFATYISYGVVVTYVAKFLTKK